MFRLFIIAALCTTLVACNNQQETKQPAVARKASSNLGATGTAQVMQLTEAYYRLKDGLVATKPSDASAAAAMLSAASDSFRIIMADDTARNQALLPLLDTIIANSRTIAMSGDVTCQAQRAAFEPLSDAMYRLLLSTGLKDAGVYRQFCPMAFNDKGAHWLSNTSDIKNPYFGKKMLECGEVTDSL